MKFLQKQIHKFRYKSYPNWTKRKPDKCISFNTNVSCSWKSKIHVTSLPSAILLFRTIPMSSRLMALVQALYDKYGADKIVFGIKNRDGKIRWEFYYYPSSNLPISVEDVVHDCNENNLTCKMDNINGKEMNHNKFTMNDNPFLISFDYQPNELDDTMLNTSIDLYYRNDMYYDENNTSVEGIEKVYSVVMYNHNTDQFRGRYIIESYQKVKEDLPFYMEKLDLDEDFHDWMLRELKRYNDATHIMLLNKKDEVGIGWLGIGYDSFKKFLSDNLWMKDLQSFWKENKKSLKHVPNECIVHYDVYGEPQRSAFYGII